MKVLWSWIREWIPGLPGVAEAAERLTLAGIEVEAVTALAEDWVLELATPPNRPDLLGHVGVARELAAVLGAGFRSSPPSSLSMGAPPVQVQVEDPAQCNRYTALVLEDARVRESPPLIRQRLGALGVRTIFNVVDATNYVLLETGQPLHAFDLDRIEGDTIQVRRAREGERIRTLDEVDRILPEGVLVIADGRGPIAVAGVIGGAETQVTPHTRRILLESARFDPVSVRRSARRLGLSTEASYRFERGVDGEGVPAALARGAQWIREAAEARTRGGRVDVGGPPEPRGGLRLRWDRLERILGVAVPPGEVEGALARLGCRSERDETGLQVAPPSWRADLTAEIDLIEEVARLAGLDRIPEVLPATFGSVPTSAPPMEFLRRGTWVLSDAGYTEVMTSTFVAPQWLSALAAASNGGPQGMRLRNPIAEQESMLRTSLLPGLLDRAAYNLRRQREGLRIFDAGRVILARPPGPLPEERSRLAGVAIGPRAVTPWPEDRRGADFFEAKGAVEAVLDGCGVKGERRWAEWTDGRGLPGGCVDLHPGRRAVLEIGEDGPVALAAEVAQGVLRAMDVTERVAVFEIELDRLLGRLGRASRIQAPPRFPSIVRDFAWWVPRAVASEALRRAIAEVDRDRIEAVELFDVFEGRGAPEGRRSLAFRVSFRSQERTLVEQEVDALAAKIQSDCASTFGATLRTQGEPPAPQKEGGGR